MTAQYVLIALIAHSIMHMTTSMLVSASSDAKRRWSPLVCVIVVLSTVVGLLSHELYYDISCSLGKLKASEDSAHGYSLLRNPLINKGMSFSSEEKLQYGTTYLYSSNY